MGNPFSDLRSVTCHMGSHSVTCHPTRVNAPRHNTSHTSRYSMYLPRGMDGWVDLGVGYIPRWFTCPQTVSHHHLIATRPWVEPTTSRSQVQRPNGCEVFDDGDDHDLRISQYGYCCLVSKLRLWTLPVSSDGSRRRARFYLCPCYDVSSVAVRSAMMSGWLQRCAGPTCLSSGYSEQSLPSGLRVVRYGGREAWAASTWRRRQCRRAGRLSSRSGRRHRQSTSTASHHVHA